jgi:anti-sigma-K factor RsiG
VIYSPGSPDPVLEDALEPLPDLKSLSDAELRDLIDRLVAEEHDVSFRRRILHGRIDILKAELQARLQRQVGEEGESPLYEVDVDKLAAILAARAAPPNPSD